MRYQVISTATEVVLDDDAIPTPHMIFDWPQHIGMAVKRGRCWYAVDYPGFVVELTEKPIRIQIREVR